MNRKYLLLLGSFTIAEGAVAGDAKMAIGAVGYLYKSPFEIENTTEAGASNVQHNLYPYIGFEAGRFYIEGFVAGYELVQPRAAEVSFGLDAITSIRAIGGGSNGDLTVDVGLSAGLFSPFGDLELAALREVTGSHSGYELNLTYSYAFEVGRLSVRPGVELSWQDRKLANYMWGVSQEYFDSLPSEWQPFLPVYEVPGGILNISFGADATLWATEHLGVVASASHTRLAGDVRANPGINKKSDSSIGLGLVYRF